MMLLAWLPFKTPMTKSYKLVIVPRCLILFQELRLSSVSRLVLIDLVNEMFEHILSSASPALEPIVTQRHNLDPELAHLDRLISCRAASIGAFWGQEGVKRTPPPELDRIGISRGIPGAVVLAED